MRVLEEQLTDEPQSIYALAAAVYGIPERLDPTRAETESVRRAAKRLAAMSRAELGQEFGRLKPGWPYRHYLTARRPT